MLRYKLVPYIILSYCYFILFYSLEDCGAVETSVYLIICLLLIAMGLFN